MTPVQFAAQLWNMDSQALYATRIKDGLTNESYRISGGPEAVIVRLSTADDVALQINRDSEAAVLQLVDVAGIGASVLLCEPQSHVLITREIPGRNPDKHEVGDAFNILRIAKLLRQLHAMTPPSSVQHMHLVKTLRGYWQLLGERENEQALAIAQEADTSPLRGLCHNDVHHLNLIDDGTRLWLLDWEYAGIGDPYFDLASVCCYHDFNAEQRSMLLDCYEQALSMQRLDRAAASTLSSTLGISSSLPLRGRDRVSGNDIIARSKFTPSPQPSPLKGEGARHSGVEQLVADSRLMDRVRFDRMCWLFNYIKELWFAARKISDANS